MFKTTGDVHVKSNTVHFIPMGLWRLLPKTHHKVWDKICTENMLHFVCVKATWFDFQWNCYQGKCSWIDYAMRWHMNIDDIECITQLWLSFLLQVQMPFGWSRHACHKTEPQVYQLCSGDNLVYDFNVCLVIPLTHWGRDKWPTFPRRHFQMQFLESKCLKFGNNLTEIWSLGFN